MVINQFPARFGRYILLDRINAGGMAEVFRAKLIGAERFERLLAIKCMLPQLTQDQHFITMFQDEAKLAAQLGHANIVKIEELGQLGRDRLYIAMELVNGRDLRHILRTAKASLTPIPVGFAAYAISKAAEGLDFAHRKAAVDGSPLNLVHRDVSPQNILVSYDGEVKVVDFGIAKAEARATETQAGVLKGKFAYMAPEQVMGTEIDRRADIFALGSVLYEVITNQRLFTGDNDLSVLEKVRAAKLPDLTTLMPEGGEEFIPVLQRALAKKVDDRYTYASEMAEDLEHLLIEDRQIFGSKRAAQFMQTLYKDEVAQGIEQLKVYAEVTAESCVATVDEEQEPANVVYDATVMNDMSSITGSQSGATNPAETHRQGVALSQRETIQRRRVRNLGQGTGNTAVQQRPTQRRLSQGPATMVEPNPVTNSKTARVLRNVKVVLMLSAFVTAILVIAVALKMKNQDPRAAHQFDDWKAALSHVIPFKPLPEVFSNVSPASPNAVTSPTSPTPAPPTEEPPTREDEDHHRVYGWFVVRSPGVEHGRVFIDGKEVGTLPLSPQRLPVGKHEIRVVDEAGNGRLVRPTQRFFVTRQNTQKSPHVVSL